MEPKPSLLKNFLVRLLLFGVLVIGVRFAYVVTIAGESCNVGDFCFFSLPENLNFVISGAGTSSAIRTADEGPAKSKDWIKAVNFYSSVFQDLIAHGYLSPESKSLCFETPKGQEVQALKEIGVLNSVGVSKKASKPLVLSGESHRVPFPSNSFDFVFSGGGKLDDSKRAADFAAEIVRTLKPEGFAVVHIKAKDTYSFNSFLSLFNCCSLLTIRDIDGFEPLIPRIREMVLKKECTENQYQYQHQNPRKCSVPGYKRDLVAKAEPLIEEEPMKPWLTLKRNIQNVKYLPSMADISFKRKYVYVDVGARSYGSSIGSWFKKQYPKQNKTFEVYAIEADKTFHEEYKLKKAVTLLPFAAWVRNETLAFEINRDPPGDKKVISKGRGMGRIQPVNSSPGGESEVDKIPGFDFAEWLKSAVTEKDFVVMKMDVEGTEFELIPRLIETGAICLVDEVFLECHYNRWQRCCPGQRSEKYDKTYEQCLDLFNSLRQSGVLVHQWW